MKKLLFTLALGCLLMSCYSDIDLANIDSKAEVNMGLALPIGSIHFTLADIMGNVEHMFIDTMGILTWRDTFPDGRSYHNVDLAERVSTKKFPLDVFAQLASYATAGTVGPFPADMTIPLEFDMPLTLNKINDVLGNERLDSTQIEEASFITTLSTENFDIQWDWIDTVRLDLGDQITRPAGNSMVVYKKGDTGDFNKKINTAIKDFTLCMMKNRLLPPGSDNVLKETTFKVHLKFTIPAGDKVTISSASKLNYDLSVSFIKYKAIWGYFKPSSEMFAEVLTPIGKSMSSLGFIKKGKYPFSNPTIKVDIETQIAGLLRIDSCYVFAEDADGNRTYADFNGYKIYRDVKLYTDPKLNPLGYMDPHDDNTIGRSIIFWTDFDKEASKGRIDRLFGSLPENIGYKFKVEFDRDRSPQVRMTPDDSININAICTLPMRFYNGLYITYDDTTTNLNLSQYSIDSIIHSSKVLDTINSTNLKLYMKACNEMPISIALKMRCLDEKGQLVMDPKDNTKPFTLFEQDSTRIVSGTYSITDQGSDHEGWHLDKEGETTMIVSLDQAQMNVLPKIKTIVYVASIDDKSMQEAHEKGYNNLSLRGEAGVNLKVGLTANIDAILNFNEKQ